MDKSRCPFEKTITSAQCGCELAQRYAIAERLGVQCGSALAAANCRMFIDLVRSHSRFALKITDTREALPFGKELKVMVGGARGLQRLIDPETSIDTVSNIHGLIQQAQQQFGSLTNLPFAEIVKSVAAHRPRRRAKNG